jgi:hypothetical protein
METFYTTLLGTTYVLAVAPMLLLGLAIPYAVIHLRGQPGLQRDPQVGIKVALYYFLSISILLLLTGLSVLVVDALVEAGPGRAGALAARGGDMRQAQRTGWALVVCGTVLTLLHLLLVKGATNDHDWPATRRVFVGWRFAIHGLVVVGAATALTIVLFQKDMGDEQLRKTLTGILIVWVPSWAIHLILLRYLRDQPRHAVDFGPPPMNPFETPEAPPPPPA